MRTVKFRIRLQHKKDKRIEIDYVTLEELLNRNGCYWTNQWEIISKDEYTGLKDKKGKEIYEGDIVKRISFVDDENILVENLEVIYDNNVFSFVLSNHKKDEENYNLIRGEDYEIIGNIYENEKSLNN